MISKGMPHLFILFGWLVPSVHKLQLPVFHVRGYHLGFRFPCEGPGLGGTSRSLLNLNGIAAEVLAVCVVHGRL
jgi:hypothetical protein